MGLALGIDIGTSGTKAVLADAEGRELWTASCSYRYVAKRQGHAEQDPEDWWAAARGVVQSLLRQAPGARGRIAGIGVSGQGVAAILLDASGNLVRPAILWLDQRAAHIADELRDKHGDEIAAISGKIPATYNVEPKLLWIKRHEPNHWARTSTVFTTTAYITYRLTGARVMNHSDGGILLGYDLRRHAWSEELLGQMGLPRALYRELAESDEMAGELSSAAALELGLRPGIPVVAGGEAQARPAWRWACFRPGSVSFRSERQTL